MCDNTGSQQIPFINTNFMETNRLNNKQIQINLLKKDIFVEMFV